MRIKTALAILAIVSPVLTHGQTTPSLKDIYQLNIDQTTHVTVPAFGGGNWTGYKFTVVQRADGALPVIYNSYSNTSGFPTELNVVFLLRRVDATHYARFLNWRQTSATPNGAGVILRPGDYMVFPPFQQNLDDRPHGVALSGFWMKATDAVNHFQWTPASSVFATVPKAGGGTYKGMKFTISARSDGALPVVNQFLTEQVGVNLPLEICKRTGSADYTLYADLDMAKTSPVPGLILTPGDYLLTNIPPDGQDLGGILKYEVRMTGYWAKP